MITVSAFAGTPDDDDFARKLSSAKPGSRRTYDKEAVGKAVNTSIRWISSLVRRDQAENALEIVGGIIPVMLENPSISLDEALELAFPDEADDTECADCGGLISGNPDDPGEYMHVDYKGSRDTEQDDTCGEARPKTAAETVRGWLDDD